MSNTKDVTDARVLLEMAAKCKRWREVLLANGWDGQDRGAMAAAAETPEAKAAEMEAIGFIVAHWSLLETLPRTRRCNPRDNALSYISLIVDEGRNVLANNRLALAECIAMAEPASALEETFIRWLERRAERLFGESGAEEANRTKADTDVPAMNRQQIDVLRALAERPRQTMIQAELIPASGVSRGTMQSTVIPFLIQHGLVHQPQGERGGYANTRKGRQIAEEVESEPEP